MPSSIWLPAAGIMLLLGAVAGAGQADAARALEDSFQRAVRHPELRATLAGDIARQHGRTAVPRLVHALCQEEQEPAAVATLILAGIADPDGKKGCKKCLPQASAREHPAVGVALLAAIDDQPARALLLQLATEKRAKPKRCHAELFELACGFLRAQGDARMLPAVDAALQRDLPDEQHRCLRGLRLAWKFRDALKNAKSQADYREFEQTLWTSLALAERGTRLNLYFADAADMVHARNPRIHPAWLERILDDPNHSRGEFETVCWLIVKQQQATLHEKIFGLLRNEQGFAMLIRAALEQTGKKDGR